MSIITRIAALAALLAVPLTAAPGQAQGPAYAWGYNGFGQIGDGTTTDRNAPVAITTSGGVLTSGVTAVAAGDNHSLAVRNGAAYAWGRNHLGQVGDGTGIDQIVPVAITTSGGVLTSGVTAVAAGGNHSLAVRNGAAYAWGSNAAGQVGDGTTATRIVPVAITTSGGVLTSGVTAVAGGDSHSLAVRNGAVYAWGFNGAGQVGDGTNNNKTAPVAITTSGGVLTSGVTAVAGGDSHSLAVRNGAVYAWGFNAFGQIGDGTATDRNAPVAITTSGGVLTSGVTAVDAGTAHSLAVLNGAVYAWGANTFGQIGDGTTTDRNAPVAVTGITGTVVSVSSYGYSSSALTEDHRLYVWGYNVNGELGLGDNTNRLSPTEVFAPNGFYWAGIDVGSSHTVAYLAPVPEPASVLLVCVAAVGGAGVIRRGRLHPSMQQHADPAARSTPLATGSG